MEKIKYKDIPFKYPDPCSDDMWFSIFVKGDKITIESIIDRSRGRHRETDYIKMKGTKIWLKTIDEEEIDDYAYRNGLGFRKYHTVRNGIFVNELPRYKFNEFYELDNRYEENENYKESEGEECEWRIPYRFLNHQAMTYLILKIQGKEKAERYANKIIKNLNTENLQKYSEEVSKLCEKYKAKRGYREDYGEFGIINRKSISNKKYQEIYELEEKTCKKYGFKDPDLLNRRLGMIEEIRQVIKYGNLKYFLKQEKNETLEECAKVSANYEKQVKKDKKRNVGLEEY